MSRYSRACWFPLFFCAAAIAGSASSFRVDTAGRVTLTPVPCFIQGVLSPLRITVDGKPVARDTKSFSALLLNGALLAKQAEGKPDLEFSTRSDASILRFSAKRPSSPPRRVEVSLPKVEEATLLREGLSLRVSAQTRRLKIDGTEIPVTGGKAFWSYPRDPVWRTISHSLELVAAPEVPVRTYRLEFAWNRELAASAAVGTSVPVQDNAPAFVPNPLRWKAFEFAPLLVLQSGGGRTTSTELSWIPRYPLHPSWALGGRLGIFPLRKADGGFAAAGELGAFVSFSFWDKWSAELGGGAQTWFGLGGTRAVGAGGVSYAIDVDLSMLRLSRISAGLTALLGDEMSTRELRLAFAFEM